MGTKCPQCQAENADQSKFCGECGSRLFPPGEVVFGQTMTLGTAYKVLTKGKICAEKYAISGEIGRGRDGSRLQGGGYQAQADGRAEVPAAGARRHPEAKERFIREAQARPRRSAIRISALSTRSERQDGSALYRDGIREGESLRQKVAKGPMRP